MSDDTSNTMQAPTAQAVFLVKPSLLASSGRRAGGPTVDGVTDA